MYCTLLKSSTDKCAALSQHKSKKGLKMLERGPTPSSTPPSADEAEVELIRRASLLQKKLSKRLLDSSSSATGSLSSTPSPTSTTPILFSPPRSPSGTPNPSPTARPRREWYINAKSFAFYKAHLTVSRKERITSMDGGRPVSSRLQDSKAHLGPPSRDRGYGRSLPV